MSEFHFSIINGLMLGIEHVNGEEINEDMDWGIVIDLFIFRLMYIRFNKAV